MLARRDPRTAVRVGCGLLEAYEVDFVPCSDFFLETFETFRSQPKGILSFTDAAIVTLARKNDGCPVATFDADFRRIENISVVP